MILFNKDGSKAYRVGTWSEVNIEDIEADIARLEDEYESNKSELLDELDAVKPAETTDEAPAAPEAPASPELPSDAPAGVTTDSSPEVQPVDVPATPEAPQPEAPAPAVIQDVTPTPEVSVTPAVSDDAPSVEAAPAPEVAKPATDEPEQPVVIQLQ